VKRFTHHSAQSMTEAIRLLKAYEGKAKVNAGGTDLLGAMRDKSLPSYPEAVIDIKTVEGLDYIKKDGKDLRIGALAKLADVAASEMVKAEYGLLAEAIRTVASPTIRNMATIGGNLAQDVRCWYYRYPRQIGGPIVCLRKGGKICSALAGDNRYHSLFGAAPLDEYPCSAHCPAKTDMPGYMDKIKKNDLAGAASILMEYNPIPAITGRVCPVFCEPECNRREFDDAVAIQCVERALGDHVLDHAQDYYAPPAIETGKRVAVVGSGPAGLAAAFYLRRAGHSVTVYEKLPEPGGMLLYSIPPFRLPKDVVRRQTAALLAMGIAFETGIEVGKSITVAGLAEAFDATIVACGTWRSLKLGVPGEEAEGVHYALEYLKKIASGERPALGDKVIVVGGGSVAIDAARSARRLGASDVQVVCLECRDPASKDRMLALDSEIRQAEEEGIVIHPSLGVQKITVKDGRASAIDAVTCLSVRAPDGTFNPQYDTTCTAGTLEADSIVIAIGQAGDPADSQAVKSAAGCVLAVGDMATGPSTVIQAVASAREAVRAVEAALNPGRTKSPAAAPKAALVEASSDSSPRARVAETPASERVRGIDVEDSPGVSFAAAQKEARRCFNCGCLAVGPSDLGVALVALDARIVTTKRTVSAGAFFRPSATCSTILGSDELIKEIRIPKAPEGARQKYAKFTLRKPIDFAVVSVASVVSVKDGVCKDARIVLGAVAPEPLRVKSAEKAIKGRPIDEKAAAQAAEAAVEGSLPLAMNDYKRSITKALVKRVVLGE
jgi:NADPH-dependent glutamate synthase beta subunit-like oxidoreductase/CO/xanthine dehydrogenase FAD-binding subunit